MSSKCAAGVGDCNEFRAEGDDAEVRCGQPWNCVRDWLPILADHQPACRCPAVRRRRPSLRERRRWATAGGTSATSPTPRRLR